MKETIEKINDTKGGSLKRSTKLISPYPDLLWKKEGGLKSINVEMKKEK